MSAAADSEIETTELERQRQISLQLASPALEGYEIVAFVGEGTYGDVWQAKDLKTGTVVAIKRLRKQPSLQSRSEARLLAGLDAARGIVALKDIHLDSEPYCYVMEYMAGGTLADLVARRGTVPFREAWRMFRELTEALGYVHRHGAVHCDIKPENILLDARGNPRLSDFGQARGQGPKGSSLGTRFYMPPEQARFDVPDARWDVYALGAILYQMLTGKKPRHSPQLATEMKERSHSGSEIRDQLENYAEYLERAETPQEHRGLEGVTPEVATLLDRCLSTDFTTRPKDAVELFGLIERCDRQRRRRPLLVFGVVTPAVMLLAAGLVVLFGGILALKNFQDQWATQVVGDNRVIARSIAAEIEARFNERSRFVRQASEDPEWAELLAPSAGVATQERVQQKLQILYQAHNGQRVRRWSLADADGVLRQTYGRMPSGNVAADDSGTDKNVAWLGWFNGRGDSPTEQGSDEVAKGAGQRLVARREEGRAVVVSQPYRRESAETKSGVWTMGTSCVVPPQGPVAPVGVLVAELDYREFNESFARFGTSALQRKVIVANERGQTLYHRQVAEQVKQEAASISIPQIDLALKEHAFFAEAFAPAPAAGSEEPAPAQEPIPVAHRDPWSSPGDTAQYYISKSAANLANGQKLAVFVLHDKEAALAGFLQAERRARWLGFGLLAVGCVVLAGNIWVLRRMLRHEEAANA